MIAGNQTPRILTSPRGFLFFRVETNTNRKSMKTAQETSKAKPCLSARWTHAESETLFPQADKKCFGDVSGWSKATVWFRRPDDVQLPRRKPMPVRNLQAIASPAKATTVEPEAPLMSGKFVSGRGDVNSLLEKSAPYQSQWQKAIESVYKGFSALVEKAPPSEAERAEIAEIRKCNERERKARLAALDKAIRAKRKAK